MRDEIVIVSGGMLENYASGCDSKQCTADFPNRCQEKEM